MRALSTSTFKDFSSGRIPLSAKIWMNESPTPGAGMCASGLLQLHVSFGDAFGSLDDVRFAPEFGVSFLEDLERLIVLWLRLSDHLEHLNRLPQLRRFART